MSSTYPTSRQVLVPRVDDSAVGATGINQIQDTVQALEDKVGITNATDTSSIDYKVNHVTSAQIVDGAIVNADINAAAGINMTKTDAATVLPRLAVWVQNLDGVNALTSNQVIYRGWNFFTGDGTTTVQKTITLPNSGFDDLNYDVTVRIIGLITNSDPTARDGINASNVHNLTMSQPTTAQTATAFTVRLADVDATNIANTRRILFSWIAVGTKA